MHPSYDLYAALMSLISQRLALDFTACASISA